MDVNRRHLIELPRRRRRRAGVSPEAARAAPLTSALGREPRNMACVRQL